MKSNYDNIAPFYDWLSRLVYGDAILYAHRFLINAIPANSSVLIAGGGTGYILEEISKKHINGLRITYVEISTKMMAFSKKRNTAHNQITFINTSICDVSLQQQFDVVITPFFFDNFSDGTAKAVFNKTDLSLTSGGLWLLADFEAGKNSRLWKKLMLKLMYFFFRIVCNIEARHLPDIKKLFETFNYRPLSIKTFYKDFIYAVIYQKQ